MQPLDQATAIGALTTACESVSAARRAELGAAADRYPLFG